jgi:flagellar biosynthesis anti-sigma factor FlgM
MAGLDGISNLGQVLGSLSPSGSQNPVSQAAKTAASTADLNATKSSSATAESSSNKGLDRANVSSTGGLVAQALATPDVRLDKVSEIRSQISQGTYQVPASAVAGKIVDSLLK